jgi:uncharacterized membrane protein YkvA (DUF1232 family)
LLVFDDGPDDRSTTTRDAGASPWRKERQVSMELGGPREADGVALKLVIELGEADLEYYRGVLRSVCERNAGRSEAELVDAARALLEKTRRPESSITLRRRMDDLSQLIAMVDDRDWALEGEDRERVISMLRYFTEPLDLIPDTVPGLGLLDDVLMLELILRDLSEELAAYRDFCRFRDEHPELGAELKAKRGRSLAGKRAALMARMRRRRERRQELHSLTPLTHPLLRFRS